jgi:hypothetical protein
MRRPHRVCLPLAQKHDKLIRGLPEELLIYDLKADKAHCLNHTAATIWSLCDGVSTPAEIAKKMARQTGQPITEKFVWLGLEQLERNRLLAEKIEVRRAARVSRRQAMRSIGLGIAVALPTVISITAPAPAQAATCWPRCHPCNTAAECCSGICAPSVSGCPGGTARCA